MDSSGREEVHISPLLNEIGQICKAPFMGISAQPLTLLADLLPWEVPVCIKRKFSLLHPIFLLCHGQLHIGAFPQPLFTRQYNCPQYGGDLGLGP